MGALAAGAQHVTPAIGMEMEALRLLRSDDISRAGTIGSAPIELAAGWHPWDSERLGRSCGSNAGSSWGQWAFQWTGRDDGLMA